MPVPTKAEIQAFEARLDRELAGRVTNSFDANATLRLASNMVEMAATTRPNGSGEGLLNDGIDSFATFLVSGASGQEPVLETLFSDLEFGFHYHHLRALLYYSYNAPGSIDWTFSEAGVELRFLDPSLPRQFFTVWNEHVLGSHKIFDGFDAPDRLMGLLKNQPEFELSEAHEAADKLLQAHADLKLSAYFSILDKNAQIDLGGYTYMEIYTVYRVLLMKALYHRYQARVNDHIGCIHIDSDELRDNLAKETNIDAARVEAMLQDLVFDSKAVTERVDSTYFSLMREGAAPREIIIRPCHFSRADGLVQLLRVIAQRRPQVFLSQVSNVLATAFVQRVKAAFEAQGFVCRSEISLRAIDPTLPDIDLLVIVEEPTLGFVMLICEVKSPLPPQWAKDQLRALAKDNVSKAFRQTEAISTFLRKPEGIEFIRSVVPKGGLEHFDSFVTVLQQLIITSDNAGMFFGHEETPVINFRTLERVLQRADGDILHMRYCISHYNEWADECVTTAMAKVEVDGWTVLHEGFTPTRLMDFSQVIWNSGSDRQRMIDDFVANGHHPFDCLVGREGVIVAPPTDTATDVKGPPAKPI